MNYAIVTKLNPNPNNPDVGYVRPFLVEESGIFRLSKPEDFPNRDSIIIKRGYEDLDDLFGENTLFRISFRDSESSGGGLDVKNPNYSHYESRGTDAKPLSQRELFHLIEEEVNLDRLQVSSVPYKPTRAVFVPDSDSNYLLGPFAYDEPILDAEGSYTIQIKPFPNLPKFNQNADWFVLKIHRDKFLIASISNQTILACNIDYLLHLEYVIVDFISDEQLVKWGNDLLSSAEKLTKQDISEYRKSIADIGAADSEFAESRKDRLLGLLDRTDLWQKQSTTLISKYLSTASGQNYIREYLETNREVVQEELKKQSQYEEIRREYEEDLEKIKQEIDTRQKELKEKNVELENTIERINQKQREELDEQNRHLQEQIQAKSEELSTLMSKVAQLMKQIEGAETITDIKSEIDYLSRTKRDLEKEIDNFQSIRRDLARQIGTDQEELRRELHKLKPYVDLLNGLLPATSVAGSGSTKKRPIQRNDFASSKKDFVKEICDKLRIMGRYYSVEEVTNYLVNIHQNFLTVFAGLPGTGKTSLASLLAQALNLARYERFLSVPVARGWTSQRDILGFYNPLNGKYRDSTTGIYQALKLCYEEDSGSIHYPYWILLDEANLSPIEHYWSSFLGMCDPEHNRSVSIGDPEIQQLIVSPAVRFIATVNHDNTTEPLSPRVIDRVPIILLQGHDRLNETNPSTESAHEGLITKEHLDTLFVPPNNQQSLTDDEDRILAEIVNTLTERKEDSFVQPIFISYRKRRQIERYCAVTRDLIVPETYPLRALDIAIAQHVLPLINGNGERYRKRLDSLMRSLKLRGLDYSRQLLQQILDSGESEYHFYRFFS